MKTYLTYNYDGDPMLVKLSDSDARSRGLKQAGTETKQAKPKNKKAKPHNKAAKEDEHEGETADSD